MSKPDQAVEQQDAAVKHKSPQQMYSTFYVGPQPQQFYKFTMPSPVPPDQRLDRVFFQPRGAGGEYHDLFVVRTVRFHKIDNIWMADGFIGRVDASSGWGMELYIDALWVFSPDDRAQ